MLLPSQASSSSSSSTKSPSPRVSYIRSGHGHRWCRHQLSAVEITATSSCSVLQIQGDIKSCNVSC